MKIFVDFEATQENEIVSIGAVTENGQTFLFSGKAPVQLYLTIYQSADSCIK